MEEMDIRFIFGPWLNVKQQMKKKMLVLVKKANYYDFEKKTNYTDVK